MTFDHKGVFHTWRLSPTVDLRLWTSVIARPKEAADDESRQPFFGAVLLRRPG